MTERSIEALMAEADRLGIPYRPNIGLATLQGKINAYHVVEAATSEPEEAPGPEPTDTNIATFTNTSKVNIFTTQGRCMPGQSVELDIEEAGNYEGLEKV